MASWLAFEDENPVVGNMSDKTLLIIIDEAKKSLEVREEYMGRGGDYLSENSND